MKEYFEQIPRLPLLQCATPLLPLAQLSQRYGIPLFVKRDDLHGVAAAGNKARKLEYLLKDAVDKGHNSVVTGGGLQSNHAATTALCAKRFKLKTYLALSDNAAFQSEHYQQGGNMVLNHLAQAEITRFPAGSNTNDNVTQVADSVESATGHRPYEIVMGGSDCIGAVGYVRAALEIANQVSTLATPPKTLVHASGSAGTQAGLIVGFALAKCDIDVIGVSVLHNKNQLTNTVLELCEQLADYLNMPVTRWRENVKVVDNFIGEGYGIPNQGVWDAMEVGLVQESLVLDPCYTGKAFQYLLSACEHNKQARLKHGCIFLHTGGVNGLMGYQQEVLTAKA